MKTGVHAQCFKHAPQGAQGRMPHQTADAARRLLTPTDRKSIAHLASWHGAARSSCRESASAVLLERLSAGETAVTNDKLRQLRCITAIKTPYLRNGKFDLPAYDAIVELQVRAS